MLLYYITDRQQFAGTDAEKQETLLHRIGDASSAGIDFIQLREKDLAISTLETLAIAAVRRVRDNSEKTRILINSRIDVALAAGADGVHLTSTDISASDARAIVASDRRETSRQTGRSFLIGASCHSPADVRRAQSHGADFAVLAPIFEKAGTSLPPLGLTALAEASLVGVPPDLRVEAGDHRVAIPVLALGGVTLQNAPGCLRAGAAGVAGIRMFQHGDIQAALETLRAAKDMGVPRARPRPRTSA